MKKILLILMTTASLYGEPFFYSTVFKSRQQTTFQKEEANEFPSSVGIQTDIPHFSVRAFSTLKKKDYESLKNSVNNDEYGSIWSTPLWAASLYNKSKKYYECITAGNLSFTGAVSRLKNPVPSIPDPLTKSFSFSSGIRCSQPTLSSKTKPLALYFSSYTNKKSTDYSFQSFYTKEDNFLCSGGIKHKFNSHSDIQFYLSGGRFFLENNSTLLKKNNCTFEKDWFYAGSIESAYTSPHFKISCQTGIHQNPWNLYGLWVILKTRLIAGPLIFDSGGYLLPESKFFPKAAPMISADSSIIKTTEQFYAALQYLIFTQSSLRIRTGITAAESWKIYGTENLLSMCTGKLTAGLLIESSSHSEKIELTAANFLISGEPAGKSLLSDKYYGLNFTNTLFISRNTFSFSLKCKQYPPVDEDQDLKQDVSTAVSFISAFIPRLTTSYSYKIKLINGLKDEYEQEFSLNYVLSKKHIHSTFKVIFKD